MQNCNNNVQNSDPLLFLEIQIYPVQQISLRGGETYPNLTVIITKLNNFTPSLLFYLMCAMIFDEQYTSDASVISYMEPSEVRSKFFAENNFVEVDNSERKPWGRGNFYSIRRWKDNNNCTISEKIKYLRYHCWYLERFVFLNPLHGRTDNEWDSFQHYSQINKQKEHKRLKNKSIRVLKRFQDCKLSSKFRKWLSIVGLLDGGEVAEIINSFSLSYEDFVDAAIIEPLPSKISMNIIFELVCVYLK